MGEKLTRRGFFGLLGGAVAAAVVAPKIYVFAPKGGVDLGVGSGPSFDGKLIATDRMRRRSVWEL